MKYTGWIFENGMVGKVRLFISLFPRSWSCDYHVISLFIPCVYVRILLCRSLTAMLSLTNPSSSRLAKAKLSRYYCMCNVYSCSLKWCQSVILSYVLSIDWWICSNCSFFPLLSCRAGMKGWLAWAKEASDCWSYLPLSPMAHRYVYNRTYFSLNFTY